MVSIFTPLLHTIPSKPKPPNLFSHSISISLSQSPPTVRQNASPTAATTTTTTNPLHSLSPTSAYIHLPFCRKRCHYCDFPIVALEKSRGDFHGNGSRDRLLGVQAFQDELLKACGRAHGVDEVHEAIGVVGTCGVENWSVDLISSLPHQTPQMWEESLLLTVNARPKHVSVYDLQVERGTKFGILYSPGEFPLPSETQSAEFYKTASRMLSDAGYNHYEISSYCKDNFECKHNLTYWDNKSFYGFGLGSTSFLGGFRFSRPKKMKEYAGYDQNLEDRVVGLSEDSFPDPKDMAMDAVMLSFRTAKGLHLKSFRKTFGTSLVHYLCKAYRPFVKSGHVVCLDRHRSLITTDRFCALLSDEEEIEETVAFIRLSDPDGFLLSNELVSLAFQVIAP
ncbi:unnamed protein product [Camellia sinensis]